MCCTTFLPFRAPASSFFSLFLLSGFVPPSLLLTVSSHLCFSIYYRKFDSKTSFCYIQYSLWPGQMPDTSKFKPSSVASIPFRCAQHSLAMWGVKPIFFHIPLMSTWCSAARNTTSLQHLPWKSLPLSDPTGCTNEIQRLNGSFSWGRYSSVFWPPNPIE